jgi:hypothetical protein
VKTFHLKFHFSSRIGSLGIPVSSSLHPIYEVLLLVDKLAHHISQVISLLKERMYAKINVFP